VTLKGSDVLNITSAEKTDDSITVVGCCSFLRPYYIFKGVIKKPEFLHGMPSGSYIAMNKKSHYMTSEIFVYWLQNHFYPRKPAG
jgi:hypothetical protein